MSTLNHQFRLAARPVGLPKRTDWSFTEEPVARARTRARCWSRSLYLSLDPAMRGWMNEGKSYIAAGRHRRGDARRRRRRGGRVEALRASRRATTSTARSACRSTRSSDGKGADARSIRGSRRCRQYLGTLGMPGMTAYFGLLDVGKPQPGETVVVSGAAGAVGQVVGQIAKIKGCRAVGIAGGREKCDYLVQRARLRRLRSTTRPSDVKTALRQHCPKGVDVYFDNVGGEILDAVLDAARAQRAHRDLRRDLASTTTRRRCKGPANYMSLLVNRAQHDRHGGVRLRRRATPRRCARWAAGSRPASSRPARTSSTGLETFPETLLKLFTRREHRQAGAEGFRLSGPRAARARGSVRSRRRRTRAPVADRPGTVR